MVVLRNRAKRFFINDQRLAKELDVVTSVEGWARDGLKKRNFRDELCKAEQTLLFEVQFDYTAIFVLAVRRHSDALEEIEHQFSENIVLLNLCLNYDCVRDKHDHFFLYVGLGNVGI